MGVTFHIPIKTFKSDITWCFYEASRSYFSIVILALMGGSIFFQYRIKHSEGTLWYSVTVKINELAPFFCPVLFPIYRDLVVRRLVSKNVSALADAAHDVFSTPQVLALGWDEVAKKLNNEFHRKGLWRTPYCFYSGLDCEGFFRHYILKAVAEQTELECDEMNRLHAVETTYKRLVEDIFKKDKKENEQLVEDSLPGDSYRSKATWKLLRKNTKNFMLIMIVCFSISICIDRWNVGVLFCLFLPLIESTITLSSCTRTTTRDRIRLLATIASIAPGADQGRWDVVAKRMNAYMNRVPNSNRLNRFFNGKDCQKYFAKELRPLATQRIKNDKIATYELVPLISEIISSSSA